MLVPLSISRRELLRKYPVCTLVYESAVVSLGSASIYKLVRWVSSYEVPHLDLRERDLHDPETLVLELDTKTGHTFGCDQRGSDLFFACMWLSYIMLGRDIIEIVQMEGRVCR